VLYQENLKNLFLRVNWLVSVMFIFFYGIGNQVQESDQEAV